MSYSVPRWAENENVASFIGVHLPVDENKTRTAVTTWTVVRDRVPHLFIVGLYHLQPIANYIDSGSQVVATGRRQLLYSPLTCLCT